MNKHSKIFVLLLALSVVFVLTAVAQQKESDTATCPVSGKEFKKSETTPEVTYEGKTYYFCCDKCKEAFVKNPEKYTQEKSHEGQKHAEHCGHDAEGQKHAEHEANDMAVDPVCGMKIKKDEAKATYEYKGKTYYFCMEGCKEKFAKNPEKFIENCGETLTCPVSGKEFTKTENSPSSTYKEKTYYFCCPGCKTKFDENPEKYTQKKDKPTNGDCSCPSVKESSCAQKRSIKTQEK